MLRDSWHAGQRCSTDVTAHTCAPAGHLGDRLNLRYFLTAGMLASAILTCAFGAGQLLGIHKMWYFTAVQACAGECHATEFPWPPILLSKVSLHFVKRILSSAMPAELCYLWFPRKSHG